MTLVRWVTGDRALFDYVYVKHIANYRLFDVIVLSGTTGDISDNYLEEAKLKVKEG